MALTKTGAEALPSDTSACRWCLLGAAKRIGNDRGNVPRNAAAQVVAALADQMRMECIGVVSRGAPWTQVMAYNEAKGRTQAEVVALLRRTAARVRQENQRALSVEEYAR